MAGVALGDIYLRLAWQGWHLWHWVGSGGVLARLVAGDAAVLCMAGMALGDIYLRFAWQAWYLRHCTPGSGGGLARSDATVLCVAGVALGDIHLRFTWQAWHLVTSTFVLCGRSGTCGAGLALVARLDAVSRR